MSSRDGVYLLLGPEQGEKDLFIKRLLERITKNTGGPPELHKFYPFETGLAKLPAILRNGSLFASYQVAFLYSVEEITRKEEIDLLVDYCAHPARSASLLLLSDEIQRVSARKRIEKLLPKENIKIFWELFPNQKLGWIINFFKKREVQIEPEAARFLLDMVENNTRALQQTCDKLALFFGRGSQITYRDVEKIIFHSKDENVYTLFERISERNLEAALAVLQRILLTREAEPVGLLNGLLRQFRRLMALGRLRANNYSLREAWTRLGVRSKKLQRVYQRGQENYSLIELERIILLLSEYDRRLRSFKSNLHALCLQLFLYYCIVQGGAGSIPH